MNMEKIPLLAPVALLVDLPADGLVRGEIGTVVERLDERGTNALLVEFSDDQGETYAMAEILPNQLMTLHRRRAA
jgi:hypothetical protein